MLFSAGLCEFRWMLTDGVEARGANPVVDKKINMNQPPVECVPRVRSFWINFHSSIFPILWVIIEH